MLKYLACVSMIALTSSLCGYSKHKPRPPMTLDQFIRSKGDRVVEGHIQKGSTKERFFLELAKYHPAVRNIAEIGFNAGHSCDLLLTIFPEATVTSFDIMRWSCSSIGKEYIDSKYPGRHHLYPGDSREAVVAFGVSNPDVVFDLIFIDGGHLFDIAVADLRNMHKHADNDTILILDDIQAPDVQRAWQTVSDEGLVELIEEMWEGQKGWLLGRYL